MHYWFSKLYTSSKGFRKISYLPRQLPDRLCFICIYFSNINIVLLFFFFFLISITKLIYLRKWKDFIGKNEFKVFVIHSSSLSAGLLSSLSSRQSPVQYHLMLSLNPQRQVSVATEELSLLHCLHLKSGTKTVNIFLFFYCFWQAKSENFCIWKEVVSSS